ncbi:hypothetical protein BD770DRAFT_439212 [Pilaira anomala]|nr:hypothetical protein BD770DRAFT_439212 [Pilaira anomala]
MSQSRESPNIKEEEEVEEELIGQEPEEGGSKTNPRLHQLKKRWHDKTSKALIKCMIKLDFHVKHSLCDGKGFKMGMAELHKDFISRPDIIRYAESQIDPDFSRRYKDIDYVRNKYYSLKSVFQRISERIVEKNLSPPYPYLHKYYHDLNKVFGSDAKLCFEKKKKRNINSGLVTRSNPPSPIMSPTPPLPTTSPIMTPAPSSPMLSTPPPMRSTPTATIPSLPTEPVDNVLNSILTELRTFNANFLYSVKATNKSRERIAAKDRKCRKKIAALDRKARRSE